MSPFDRFDKSFQISPLQLIAAASVLVVMTGIPAFLWFQERQERLQAQEMGERLQSSHHGILVGVSRLEQSSNHEHRREREQQLLLEARLAEMNQPQPNTRVYELLIKGAPDGNRLDYEVNVPPSAKSYTLKIMTERLDGGGSYAVELINRRDQSSWRSEGLEPDQSGSLFITFPRAFLSEGRYRFRLLEQKGRITRCLGEHHLTLKLSRS